MNSQAPKFIARTADELELYKSYAMWNAYHSQIGFYSAVPAYHQIVGAPSGISGAATAESLTEQIQQFNRESPNSLRDFKLICEHCGSVYTSRKRLQNHYEKCTVLHPHLEELISCRVCKRTFKTNPGYANHMTKFHGEVATPPPSPPPQDASGDADGAGKSIFHSIDMLARSDSSGKL